jgi:hypothetical protein
MATLDGPTIAGIGAAAVGLTQILRDFGLQGEWNKLACLVIATGLGAIYLFDPPLWNALILPLIGTTGTGLISKIHELAKQVSPSTGQ